MRDECGRLPAPIARYALITDYSSPITALKKGKFR